MLRKILIIALVAGAVGGATMLAPVSVAIAGATDEGGPK